MKANEFVKKFGWAVAVKLSNEMTGITQDVADCVACWCQSEWDYLKRLVESHELVTKRGGLSEAKAVEQQYWNSGVGAAMIVAMELKQAILDVESCL